MKSYLFTLGFDIWKSIVDGYIEPNTPPPNVVGKRLIENNEKTKNVSLCGLTNSIFTKVMRCKLAKEIWDKLENTYEGDEKVKREKLQVYAGKFEGLRMEEDENIVVYFLWVDEIIITIR